MSQVKEIFEAFASANEALERLPLLEAQLNATLEAEASAKSQISDLLATIELLNGTLDLQRNAIRSLEVERDNAGFRELETQDKLDNAMRILGNIGDVVRTAVPAAPAEAVVEVTSDLPTMADILASVVESQAPEPAPTEAESPIIEGVTCPIIGDAWSSPTLVEIPTEQRTPPQGPLTLEDPGIVPPALPYLNWASWTKPGNVSWKEFIKGGGNRASYLTDRDIESDYQARQIEPSAA